MTSDDQYETFWYDLKLPDLAEENDTSKDKIGELNNINNFTKDGWKLISIIPFQSKKIIKKFIYIDYIFKELVEISLKRLVKNFII